ncbi:hypothetical protein CDCA_CDCA01G0220 [Cyanidium caldarium]|uniref:Glycosyl transferase CAP10 domain-containing protein n=1 Tax=Cyanidium caldarium TaxID=2771 RepID=A0AAV9IQ24_CYACA|nr:hypothetical protein CDCA_CDCA01G0220 [Cyanidium caldarium]
MGSPGCLPYRSSSVGVARRRRWRPAPSRLVSKGRRGPAWLTLLAVCLLLWALVPPALQKWTSWASRGERLSQLLGDDWRLLDDSSTLRSPPARVPERWYTDQEVVATLQALAKRYLAPFAAQSGRRLLRNALETLRRQRYATMPSGARKATGCVLWRVRNGTATLHDPYNVTGAATAARKPFWQRRLRWTAQLLQAARLPQAGFALVQCVHDCVQTVRRRSAYAKMPFYAESDPRPIFTTIHCSSLSDDIPLPVFEAGAPGMRAGHGAGFDDWDVSCALYAAERARWQERQAQAVFRGGRRDALAARLRPVSPLNATDHTAVWQTALAYGRESLWRRARRHPRLLDMAWSAGHRDDPAALSPLQQQRRFRYAVYAEGNCGWADRLWRQLHGSQVVLQQQSPCGSFFEPLLQPFVHTVPCTMSFRDLPQRIRWLRRRDRDARQLASNANHFALAFLSRRGMLAYTEAVLQRYAQRIQ